MQYTIIGKISKQWLVKNCVDYLCIFSGPPAKRNITAAAHVPVISRGNSFFFLIFIHGCCCCIESKLFGAAQFEPRSRTRKYTHINTGNTVLLELGEYFP